jgi:hypothetical protein
MGVQRADSVHDEKFRILYIYNCFCNQESEPSSSNLQMSYIVRFAGILLFVFAYLLARAAWFVNEADGARRVIFWVMSVALSVVGAFLYKKGKQLAQLNAIRELENDNRNPIVYLRSFAEDWAAAKSENDPFIAKFLSLGLPQNLSTEEEQLAKAVKRFGPFVAIGDPKELLPQLGASRIYADNTAWKDVVVHLIEIAQLVVLRVGETPGFWWEVKTTIENKEPQKIIFLLPENREKYNAFKTKLFTECMLKVPNDYFPVPVRGQSFSAVLAFDSDWKSHIIYCKEHSNWWFYNGPENDFREILQNILVNKQEQNLTTMVQNRPGIQKTLFAKIQRAGGIIFLGFIFSAFIAGFIEACTNSGEIKVRSFPTLVIWSICSFLLFKLVRYGEKSP